jgi:pSer/pThr/pTyr-binding forkhead associated (FHA) protein
MAQNITLIVKGGRLEGMEFALEPYNRYVIGRGTDCDFQLPRDVGPLDISRQHCLLETTGRTVSIRDLGSMHGTYVNGEKIGQRSPGQPAESADHSRSQARQLHNGDEIRIGNTVLGVVIDTWAHVFEPLHT